MLKAHFLTFGCSTLALAGSLGLAAPALAQDAQAAAEAQETTGAEIIVTARRREERLVDVPIAVTSFSGAQLEKSGAIDVTDIAQSAPNVTLEPSRGTNSTLSAFIRGVGQQDPVSGFEQGVGIYLDDVYLNRPQAAVLDIYDVERIEVLRGPQGTLYGRNTIGGAVKYVTRQLPQDFYLKVKGTIGTYDQADGVVTVSAPISDLVRVGGSVARLTRDGFGKNLTTGAENYNKNVWAARGSLDIGGYGAPVLIRISGDYTHDKSNARGGHRLIPGFASGAPVLSDVFDTRGGLTDPKQDVEAYGFAINATAELTDALTFKSISSWRKDNSASPIDFDALPTVDLDVPAFYHNEQVSQEFQLQWDDGGPLQGLVGVYYLDATADTYFDSRLYTTYADVLPMLTGHTEADVSTKTYAIFGDFTYDLTDQFSLSLGGRYTWDKRKANILKENYILGGSAGFQNPGVLFSTDTDFSGGNEFKKFTPRVSLSFKPSVDHNIYASYSKGFKGGGFDPRGVGKNANDLDGNGSLSDAEIAQYLSFKPETVDSYELGYKGNLLGGALYVAGAIFRMDYTDIQIPGSVACTVNGVPTFCGVVSNAGKARMQGAELEANARLGRDLVASGDRLNFSTAIGYIDAKFKKYETLIGGQTVDVARYRNIQNTPKWTASGTLSYATPVGAGELSVSTTVSYRSKTHQFEFPSPYLDQKGYALWDASLVYSAPGSGWSIGLHGKNLLDKEYITSGYSYISQNAETGAVNLGTNGYPIPTLGSEGTLTAFYGNPRQVFLTATVEF
ncbi:MULTISPECIES: TonB-dependent receptor [Novosphingobium]|uniref:Iron complex outermembrane recepter protein n=1 Tax=Novosphingobium mathurense TaxID=428990 RepID=A0A1U6IHG8_9SPHN|nr:MULTISPECIES: TonB-dependent receptor [Novosphingobium]CDO36318.1 TonB-dependent receptor [Novosphingobium sp. KN65.2]SLK07467.1 iron complex outermembrane recepter protein [Novosphingobium mathurense]